MSHLDRMEEEEKELRVRIGKLGVFTSDTNSVFMSLPIAEREDMLAQLHSMENYHYYLSQRISRAAK